MTQEPSIERWAPGTIAAEALNAQLDMRTRALVVDEGPPDPAELTRYRDRERSWWVHGKWCNPGPAPKRAVLHHVVRNDQAVLAAAISFRRRIHTENGSHDVLALGGVVSDPAARGQGFGKAVILDAFARIEEESMFCSLFQTGDARGLYEKLGAVTVDNRFVDASADDPEANPWSDRFFMVFPGDTAWPDGTVDLNGPGY